MFLRRRSLGSRSGFTLPEVLIASFIMIIIMSSLVMTLRVGDLSTSIGTETIDVESDVKVLIHWLSKDIRQAKIQELNENAPATGHIKYNLWEWDNATLTQEKTDEYIEYDYDPDTDVLTRRYIVDNVTTNEVDFTDITMAPFYTSYTNESVNDFNSTALLGSRRLIVAIKKEKVVRGNTLNFTMVEEIRIRNE